MSDTGPARGRTTVGLIAGAALVVLIRRASLTWGTSPAERRSPLPGDDLIPSADLCATRAITIQAPVSEVWPWIAQLGQGRGGFYSYDFLENLVGCDIHSANRIVPEWQNVAVGDPINLYPGGGLTVARVEPPSVLVLQGGMPAVESSSPFDFTWAFALRPEADDVTRLVVRERYSYRHRWIAAVVEPIEFVSFAMTHRMLHGIRSRAEQRL